MNNQLSPFVFKALVDVITGGAGHENKPSIGIYRSGPKLEQFFFGCGIAFRLNGASRVPATLAQLDQTYSYGDGFDAIKRVIEMVCDPRDYLETPEKALAVREHLNKVLETDGFAVAIINGKAHLVERQISGVLVKSFLAKVAVLDFDTVQIELARALPNLVADPEDAVTAACSLIEAVCRSILMELELPMPVQRDVDGLVKAIQGPLGLSPSQTGLPKEIEQDVRQILGGLTSVAKGIGALRTHGGDAHGRERGFKRIDPHLARFAIYSAASIATFLIETWELKENRALPQHE